MQHSRDCTRHRRPTLTAFETALQATRTPPQPITIATQQYAWYQARRALEAQGCTRLEAIKRLLAERPDLARAAVVTLAEYKAV